MKGKNDFFESFALMSMAGRLVLALGCALFLLMAFYFLFYVPNQEERTRLRNNLFFIEAELNENSALLESARDLDKLALATDAAYKYARRYLPAENELPRLIQTISDLKAQSGLQVKEITPKLPAVIKDDYAEMSLDMTLEGPFLPVLNFLYGLSMMDDRIVNITTLSLDSPKMIEGDMVVSVKCVGVTYRALTEAEMRNQAVSTEELE